MRAFNILFEQARGEEPLSRGSPVGASPVEVSFLRDVRTLPPDHRAKIETYVRHSAVLYNEDRSKPGRKLVGGRPRYRHI